MAEWRSYLAEPLPLGGAAKLYATFGAGIPLRVVAVIAPAPATAFDDPSGQLYDLVKKPNGSWSASAFGALRGVATISWFTFEWDKDAQADIWKAGPVVPNVPLDWTYTSQEFPWGKPWVVARLQEVQAQTPPLGDRPLTITGAFPRATAALPCLSVQVTSLSPASAVVGDLKNSGVLVGSDRSRTRQYTTTINLIAWAETPEDRDLLAPWLGQAMEVLVDAARFAGIEAPDFSIQESEDYEVAGVPLFLVTATLTFTAWSCQSAPVPTGYGRIST